MIFPTIPGNVSKRMHISNILLHLLNYLVEMLEKLMCIVCVIFILNLYEEVTKNIVKYTFPSQPWYLSPQIECIHTMPETYKQANTLLRPFCIPPSKSLTNCNCVHSKKIAKEEEKKMTQNLFFVCVIFCSNYCTFYCNFLYSPICYMCVWLHTLDARGCASLASQQQQHVWCARGDFLVCLE